MATMLSIFGPAFVAAIVPLAVQVIKAILPQIPKWLLPIAAGAFGPAVDQGLTLISQYQGTGTIGGVLLGLAGVGVREIVNQVAGGGTPPAAPK